MALAQLVKRFPNAALKIEELLVQAIHNPVFAKNSRYSNRTAQDHAYDALWQLVVG